MNAGMYRGESALAAYEKWQQMISQNIASASIPGYRKNEIAFSAVAGDVQRLGNSAAPGKSVEGFQPKAENRLSFVPGDLKHTGSDLDFAIQGPGLFRVQPPAGDIGYTAAGEF